MQLILTAVAAGVLGTLVMDALNVVVAGTGLIARIDVATIGRMSAGWARGRFRYRRPDEMRPVAREKLLGVLTHYAIGVGLALPLVVGWDLAVGTPLPPVWMFAYGVATTAASWFLVYPSMGLGILGSRSPEPVRSALSSLANHVFYGAGMAAAVALM
jgi:hypothetical protein